MRARCVRLRAWTIASVVGALLAACVSGPQRDGPGSDPPAGLAGLPDAQPRIERLRSGGPNKPYEVFGHSYVPLTGDVAFSERGLASWYGAKFHRRPTASGEPYDMYAMTAAHPTLPIPSYARIRNPANGRSIVVRINDRGPFHAGRIVDLSYAAALRLGVLQRVAPVELQRITFDEIRSGAWRREPGAEAAPAVAAALATAAAASPAAAPTPASADAADASPPAPVAAAPQPTSPAVPAGLPAPGFWLQLGAFREPRGAAALQASAAAEAAWLAPLLAVFGDAAIWRVQAGPYATRDEADAASNRVRAALGVVPMLLERR